MCDSCSHVLTRKYFSHTEENCPLGAATYCSICCSYGHSVYGCNDRPTTSINTLKEISPNKIYQKEVKNTLTLAKDDRSKHHFLYSQGISRAGKTEELNRKCDMVAKERGFKDGVRFE